MRILLTLAAMLALVGCGADTTVPDESIDGSDAGTAGTGAGGQGGSTGGTAAEKKDAAFSDAAKKADAAADKARDTPPPVPTPPAENSGGPCKSNSECPAEEYCTLQYCDRNGHCVPRPKACLPKGRTVCACDGKSYVSVCLAQMAGYNLYNDSCFGACEDDGRRAHCIPGG